MENAKKAAAWTEQGYILFAEEGMEGIQIERLARILALNKSGFYHYFGDLDGFFSALLELHKEYCESYLTELRDVINIDPEFLNLVVKYKLPVMFHIQLLRCKDNSVFQEVADGIDRKENVVISDIWSHFIGIYENPDLALRYFDIIRDMFYTRASFQTINYPFLQSLMVEAKGLVQEISDRKEAHNSNEPLL
jgi:AcrR family transcriptional regulator